MLQEKNKVVFIVSSLSQPRCIKRIHAFYNAGYECEVYGYDRKKYNCNNLPEHIKVTVLGVLKDGEGYLNKIRTLRRDIKEIVKVHKKEKVLYYSFGFFSTVSLFLRGQKYIYEISDILYGYPQFSKVLWLFKMFDKRFIRKSVLTVMTSEGFREFLGVNYENVVIQPNKVNCSICNIKRNPLRLNEDDRLVFSYVGAIRYETVFAFAETIGYYFPTYEFHFYGQATGENLEKCTSLVKRFNNIKYFGAFKNPEDLEQIYNNISIVVACYTPKSLNERIAEPNKLYEAMFFCKPIVVSKGIFLSRQVEKYGCGFAIDATSEENIVDFINSLKYDMINQISNSEAMMDASLLVDNPSEILQRVNEFYSKA